MARWMTDDPTDEEMEEAMANIGKKYIKTPTVTQKEPQSVNIPA